MFTTMDTEPNSEFVHYDPCLGTLSGSLTRLNGSTQLPLLSPDRA